jgi:hypothetical protein
MLIIKEYSDDGCETSDDGDVNILDVQGNCS